MFSIRGNDITLTRGDSLYLTINMQKDGEEYIPQEGDVIRFAMKRNYKDSSVVLEKDIPIDTLVLTILPGDTKPLAMNTKYVYDIELTTADGDVDTFLSGNFIVDNEVL